MIRLIAALILATAGVEGSPRPDVLLPGPYRLPTSPPSPSADADVEPSSVPSVDLGLPLELSEIRKKYKGHSLWLKDGRFKVVSGKNTSWEPPNLYLLQLVDIRQEQDEENDRIEARAYCKGQRGELGYVVISNANVRIMAPIFDNAFYFTDPKKGHKWPKGIWNAIESRQVLIGMNEEQAMLAWGAPDRSNTTTTAYGISRQWVYGRGLSDRSYLYFHNGIVTTIQN